MFSTRRSTGSGTGLPKPTATIDIKGPAIAFHLRKLGLRPGASWEQIEGAHGRLVSDLTPGPGATHSKVQLARSLHAEVDAAYSALRRFQPKKHRSAS